MKLPVSVISLWLLWLTSCTNLCQNVADFGAEYSGVVLTERDSCFVLGGKYYLKGQRARFRRTYVDHPFAIAKPRPDEFTVKSGTLGETVYREIRLDKEGGVQFADGSVWMTPDAPPEEVRPLGDAALSHLIQSVNHGSRELTAHALYAYPLSAVTLVCIDLPLNLAAPVLMMAALPVMAAYGVLSPN